MTTIENKARIEGLKKIKSTQWVGETKHDNIDKCLTAINLFQGANSGWYTPKAIRIKGVQGIYMINDDGNINYESRIIKVNNTEFRIEHLSNDGCEHFESEYFKQLEL